MRGLKLCWFLDVGICGSVASFTDAWIETGITGVKTRWWGVASFTDAWIETTFIYNKRFKQASRIFYRCVDWNLQTKYSSMSIPASHLLQMRGLKPRYTRATAPICVASFTDAWIETRKEGKLPRITPSRIFYRCVDWNLPICKGIFLHFVASFTDAWIETKRH